VRRNKSEVRSIPDRATDGICRVNIQYATFALPSIGPKMTESDVADALDVWNAGVKLVVDYDVQIDFDSEVFEVDCLRPLMYGLQPMATSTTPALVPMKSRLCPRRSRLEHDSLKEMLVEESEAVRLSVV
jgi:hypothetical protein